MLWHELMNLFIGKIDYDTDQVSIMGEPWTKALQGPKGEYVLALDDGLSEDTLEAEYAFDVADDFVDTFLADGTLVGIQAYLRIFFGILLL